MPHYQDDKDHFENKLLRLKQILSDDSQSHKDRIASALRAIGNNPLADTQNKPERKSELSREKELDPRYQLMLDHSPLGILHFNREGILTHCNDQLVSLLGSDRESLLGINMNSLPDEQVVEALNAALNGETGHYRGHYRAVTSGKVTPVHAIFLPLKNENGVLNGGIAVIDDVTDRIESEKELRKFRLGIDRSPNPVIITDPDGTIRYVNYAFEELYGYSSSESIGKNPRILKSGHQDREFYRTFWETIHSGDVSQGEMVNKTRDGELVYVLYSCSPIIGYDGEITGFISIQDDITSRKEMEQSLREALDEKDLMLSEIHHRVKNNLALISALLTLQVFKTDDETLQQKLSENTLRIKTIANVHEYLYESGDLSNVRFIDNAKVLVDNITRTYNRPVQVNVEWKGENLKLGVTQTVHLLLILNEVIANILQHAFHSEDEAKIVIEVSERENQIRIDITDNGTPLPEGFPESADASMGLELISILQQQLNAECSFRRIESKDETFNRFTCTAPIVTPDDEVLSFRKFREGKK